MIGQGDGSDAAQDSFASGKQQVKSSAIILKDWRLAGRVPFLSPAKTSRFPGSLEEDYRPPPRATGHERALCICGFRGRVFLNNAQLYLPGCNHVAEQFEPFGTFEDTGY